jgi:uncharacterized protein DUF6011
MTSTTCQICGRNLENLDSINRGIGPECLAKREKFLAAAGSSVAEVEAMALTGKPAVMRLLPIIGKAIGAGRQDHVNRFLQQARELAKMLKAA